jgi:hypothetical protein
MEKLFEFERMIAEFDEQLKPIANRPFDLNDPDFKAKLLNTQDPLDEAGIRSEMTMLLTKITEYYANCDQEARQDLRFLFDKYHSFSWAATFSRYPTTPDGIRRQLLLFSIIDQGRDSRDAILWLQGISGSARSAGINIDVMLKEVADFSSEINKYGMGSTKGLLLNACKLLNKTN